MNLSKNIRAPKLKVVCVEIAMIALPMVSKRTISNQKTPPMITSCSYYRSTDGEIEKIPIIVTSEETDTLKIASISNVSKVITH